MSKEKKVEQKKTFREFYLPYWGHLDYARQRMCFDPA